MILLLLFVVLALSLLFVLAYLAFNRRVARLTEVIQKISRGDFPQTIMHKSRYQLGVLEAAIEGNIVADFPLINKSFNCSYAGVDL